ncbi:hypothetical protein CHU93_16785 [Sandarakinorhabdus cyanobacteriorum]|uniref:Toprim domain-containing protein n=1 Tax=Sandarakinorhabdus cyanobacteriorum TaxID=1981098 RepID=A0A255Y5L2_9SPHN|nr:toprim domain-containing protein [Sandarakinorhabdus cyanobacteriorum]OYQ23905.1 hypothetical protein CHU93_16785 [Sandarakinorhabdus cyanobacteriorum]
MSTQLMHGSLSAFQMVGAMRAWGIEPIDPSRLMADLQSGRIVRFRCLGERKKSGWAVLRLDGPHSGSFGSWRLGITGHWHSRVSNSASGPSAVEIASQRARELAAAEQRHAAAAERAREIWSKSHTPGTHDYLQAKALYLAARGIHPLGRYISVKQYGGHLIVPLGTTASPICNLQAISHSGQKRFLPNGRTKGAFWSAGFDDPVETIAIGEGFATMAAVYVATGLPTAAAMSASNLSAVATALYGRHPGAKLIMCADMDTGPNPGLAAATSVAAALPGALVAKPPMPRGWSSATKGWDFSDVFLCRGGEDAIRRALGMTEMAYA